MELAQVRVQWRAVVLAVLNHQVLLPDVAGYRNGIMFRSRVAYRSTLVPERKYVRTWVQ
jgi:hypothetical protein